jgi:glycosyltransferase involved in cell wall biosynthesis
MLAIRLLGVPQVYTAHELLPWTARPYHRAIFRALYAVVDQVVAHRADQREALIRHFGVPPRRISVIALGGYAEFVRPSLTQSDARTRLGIPAGARVALFFGAIRPSKGLDVLLAAWPAVSAIIPDALLLVVGKPYKGMRVEQLDETIRGSGLAGRVRTDFRQVEPTAANDYYRAADVVVLPYDEIGTSGVLRYAYGSARAVVATSVGEHSAHVVPGETGELVPPGDPEALAQALGTVLGDTSYARALGQNGLAYASRNFAWSDSAALLLGLYRTLTERADPRGSDMRGLRP